MKRAVCLFLTAALLLCLCACGRSVPNDGRLQVVCTLFPYYDFVRAIGGDEVNAVLLVAAGRETHSFEPTPSDVVTLSESDVFFCNGGEGEVWIEDILGAAGEDIGSVVKMMERVDLLEEEQVEGMEHDHAHHDEDEQNTHGHADDPYHGSDHGEHEHNDSHEHDSHEEEITYDEHIWTSPVTAQQIVQVICEELCAADPAHAQLYRRRSDDYIVQLQALDAQLRSIAAHGARHIMVFGDRFPLLYFCREYGLSYRAAFHGCASDTEPSLSTLKYLIDKVAAEQIPVVYTIELSSGKIADAIAETTGAAVRTFQTCQSISREDYAAGETYLSLMARNAEVLQEGLS